MLQSFGGGVDSLMLHVNHSAQFFRRADLCDRILALQLEQMMLR